MKHLGRVVAVMACTAGLTSLSSFLVVGCSGDDTTGDAGDARLDTTADTTSDVVPPSDATDVETSVDAGPCDGDTICKFRDDLATAICNRFQTCCMNFDVKRCVQLARASGWEYSNQDITDEALRRGNMQLDTTSAQTCISQLATLSCPTVTTNEFKALTDNCYKAVAGKLGVGAACIYSTECQSGNYCDLTVSNGTTDAGTKIGKCAALLAQNKKCGQQPYIDRGFTSEQCAYKGWQTPPAFCNYDLYPDDAGNYFCDKLRANGAVCYTDNECTSGLCSDTLDSGDCNGGTCTCQPSKSLKSFCKAFAIQDAGPG